VHLILFAHHKPDCAPLFLLLEAEYVIKKEYHVDCHIAKVAKFFFVCESHIDPDMRVTVPAAMMAKGYSDKESKKRMLQMQVRWEVEKSGDLIPPALPAKLLSSHGAQDITKVMGY
jgi:hypothetical protein